MQESLLLWNWVWDPPACEGFGQKLSRSLAWVLVAVVSWWLSPPLSLLEEGEVEVPGFAPGLLFLVTSSCPEAIQGPPRIPHKASVSPGTQRVPGDTVALVRCLFTPAFPITQGRELQGTQGQAQGRDQVAVAHHHTVRQPVLLGPCGSAQPVLTIPVHFQVRRLRQQVRDLPWVAPR